MIYWIQQCLCTSFPSLHSSPHIRIIAVSSILIIPIISKKKTLLRKYSYEVQRFTDMCSPVKFSQHMSPREWTQKDESPKPAKFMFSPYLGYSGFLSHPNGVHVRFVGVKRGCMIVLCIEMQGHPVQSPLFSEPPRQALAPITLNLNKEWMSEHNGCL